MQLLHHISIFYIGGQFNNTLQVSVLLHKFITKKAWHFQNDKSMFWLNSKTQTTKNVKRDLFDLFHNSFWPGLLINSVVTYMWLLLKRLLLLLLFLFPFPECLRMSPWCRAGWLWWTMVVGPPAPPVDKYGKHFVKYYNGILLFAEFCQSKLQSRLGTD